MQNFSGGSPNFRPGKSRRIKKLIQKKRKIRLHVAFLSQKTSRVQRIYIDSWRYISHCAFLTWLLTHWSITEKISNGFLLPPKRNPIETKWIPKKRSNIINLCRFISSWTRFLALVYALYCRSETITLLLMNEYLCIFTAEFPHASAELSSMIIFPSK